MLCAQGRPHFPRTRLSYQISIRFTRLPWLLQRCNSCLLTSHPKTLLGAPAPSLWPCRSTCPHTRGYHSPASPACYPHLHRQLLTAGHVKESRRVVVLIQHSDIDGSRGAAGWCSPILHDHQELVAGLLLPVQAVLGAELPCEEEVRTQISPKASLEKSLCSGTLLGSPAGRMNILLWHWPGPHGF